MASPLGFPPSQAKGPYGPAHRPRQNKPSQAKQAKPSKPGNPAQAKPAHPTQARPGPELGPGFKFGPRACPKFCFVGVGRARPKFCQNPKNPDWPEMVPHASVWPLNRGKRTAVPFRTQIFHPIFRVGPLGPYQMWPGGLGEFPGHCHMAHKEPVGPVQALCLGAWLLGFGAKPLGFRAEPLGLGALLFRQGA